MPWAIVGGNWNNTAHDGALCVNLNNTPSNANANNGASLPYRLSEVKQNASRIAVPLGKNELAAGIRQ